MRRGSAFPFGLVRLPFAGHYAITLTSSSRSAILFFGPLRCFSPSPSLVRASLLRLSLKPSVRGVDGRSEAMISPAAHQLCGTLRYSTLRFVADSDGHERNYDEFAVARQIHSTLLVPWREDQLVRRFACDERRRSGRRWLVMMTVLAGSKLQHAASSCINMVNYQLRPSPTFPRSPPPFSLCLRAPPSRRSQSSSSQTP